MSNALKLSHEGPFPGPVTLATNLGPQPVRETYTREHRGAMSVEALNHCSGVPGAVIEAAEKYGSDNLHPVTVRRLLRACKHAAPKRVTDPAPTRITREMVKASGRTMEQVSLAAGLKTFACANALAKPDKIRPSTHAKLISGLTAPIPEVPEYARDLRARRKDLGVSQSVLARVAGTTVNVVSRFERTGEGPLWPLTKAIEILEKIGGGRDA